ESLPGGGSGESVEGVLGCNRPGGTAASRSCGAPVAVSGGLVSAAWADFGSLGVVFSGGGVTDFSCLLFSADAADPKATDPLLLWTGSGEWSKLLLSGLLTFASSSGSLSSGFLCIHT